MTDCTSLAGEAAAGYSANDVKLLSGLSSFQRLTNDQLQGVQTEVVVEGTIVDGDFTSTARESDELLQQRTFFCRCRRNMLS